MLFSYDNVFQNLNKDIITIVWFLKRISKGAVTVEENIIIQLQQVSCKVGNKYLLNDINWIVKEGEHWVIFGMNGSGKTTLLSIIAGFRQYTTGLVQLFGQQFDCDTVLNMRKKVGWVSSSFFDKYYTKEAVIDIVLSGKYGTLGINGQINVSDRKRAKELLNELGLKRQSEYIFDMLSKGERQNVLIARALFSSPEILVLDEPCTGLDIYNREYLFKTLEALSEKKLTIIYVTHYLEEIKPMFDKCLLLRDGHIFAKGNTLDLLNSDIITTFLHHPVIVEKSNEQTMYSKVTNVKPNIVKFFD